VTRGDLSDIEGCILGLLSERGPATPYAIRTFFLDSPSPSWSGSAGTIYPLIERLLRRKLVRSRYQLVGKRRRSVITIATGGVDALVKWYSLPIPECVVGVPPDPLRTRVRFLEATLPSKRRLFIVNAYRGVADQLRIVQEDCELKRAPGGPPYLMARGALVSLQSRLAYLREVAAHYKIELS
jgi:DNA-binding PadR family transcriptional regulator